MRADAEQICEQLRRVLAAAEPREAKAKRAAALIREAGPYCSVGLYDVGAEEIAVVAWSGPAAPTHPRFPRTMGLNGLAVRSGEAVIVGDVTARTLGCLAFGVRSAEQMTIPKESDDVVGASR